MPQGKIPVDKAMLRTKMRADRLAFAQTASAIDPPPQFIAALRRPGVLASYMPTGGEADPSLLVAAARSAGYQIALPHVTTRSSPMRFLSWQSDDPLITGTFGLQQPAVDAPVLIPDVVLTPLLAFDGALNRLGQGAGYYDRAFADLPSVLRIGVAWSIQRVSALRAYPWDMPLHGVITEQGWIDAERHE